MRDNFYPSPGFLLQIRLLHTIYMADTHRSKADIGASERLIYGG